MSESITVSVLFERKLKELEEARDSLNQTADSVGDLSEKIRGKQMDLKVAKQEHAKLKSQVESELKEIRGNVTTDIGDVEKAYNKMGEFKKLIRERDESSGMVEGLEREISALKRTIEEQKKETRKDVVARQQVISQDIDILVKAAKIFEVSLDPKPVKTQPDAKSKKDTGNSRRKANQGVLDSLSKSATPSIPSQSSSFQFTLSEEQRTRINTIGDCVFYGSRFGHAGVLRKNSDFVDNADILESVANHEFDVRLSRIPQDIPDRKRKFVLQDGVAVRNRIMTFPIWDFDSTREGVVLSELLDVFLTSREQATLQLKPKAS